MDLEYRLYSGRSSDRRLSICGHREPYIEASLIGGPIALVLFAFLVRLKRSVVANGHSTCRADPQSITPCSWRLVGYPEVIQIATWGFGTDNLACRKGFPPLASILTYDRLTGNRPIRTTTR